MAIARQRQTGAPVETEEQSPHVGRRMSLEEFLRLPEEKPALEYVDGVVSQKMSPTGPHSRLQPQVWWLFESFLRPRELGWAFTELRTSYTEPKAEASVVPDVAVYLRERIPTKPSGEVADRFFLAPDIAIEIMSPGQTVRQLTERARLFLQRGSRVVLAVDPRQRAVRTYRAGAESGPLRGADVVDLGDVLPGFSFVVEELFASIDVPRP
jgi:Uma2 family endonuclease